MNENKLQIYKKKIQYYKTLINQVGGTFEIFIKTKEGEYSKISDDLYTGYGYTFYDNMPDQRNKNFEGKFKDGLKNGKGISYYPNLNKFYEGEYKDNTRNGYGIQYDPNNTNIKEFEGFIGEIKLNNSANINIGEDKWLCTKFNKSGKIIYYGYISIRDYDKYNGNGILFNDKFEPKAGFFQNGEFKGTQVTSDLYKTFAIYNNVANNIVYIGDLKGGNFDGFGVLFDSYLKIKLYEGEFKDNNYNGRGIEYYIDGTNEIYEGEFKDNIKNGYGILYYENGKKKYEGEWKKSKYNGQGIEYYMNGIDKKYEGKWIDDKRNGEGIEYLVDKHSILNKIYKSYEGSWKDDKKNGKGVYYWENGRDIRYKGDWEDNMSNGYGTMYYKNGNKNYEGNWMSNDKNGQGIAYYDNGIDKYYEGEWKDNKEHGKGISYHGNGNKHFKGEWIDGFLNGQGIEYYENGINIKYEGAFGDDSYPGYHGYGTEYYENGNKKFEGNWMLSEKNGKGVQYWENGIDKRYEGDWKDGLPNGQCIEYYQNRNKAYEGKFKDGKYNGHGVLYYRNNNKKYYEGEFKDNLRFGRGIQYYSNDTNTKEFEGFVGEIKLNNSSNINLGEDKWLCTEFDQSGKITYYGYIKDDQYNGNGILFSDSFEIESGYFENGDLQGTQVTSDLYKTFSISKNIDAGTLYIGDLKGGKFDGFGVLFNLRTQGLEYWENGIDKKYEGEWTDNKKNGNGISYWENGNKQYEGEWKYNKRNGQGIGYYQNGNKQYEGESKDGEWNGQGVQYDLDGNKKYEGEFRNGIFVENNSHTILVLQAAYDYNRAFDESGDEGLFKVFRQFNHSLNFVYKNNISNFNQLIDEIKKYNKISHLVIMAHGDTDRMIFSYDENGQLTQYSDHIKRLTVELNNNLVYGASILLHSCLVGQGGIEGDNFSNKLASWLKPSITVYGSEESINRGDLLVSGMYINKKTGALVTKYEIDQNKYELYKFKNNYFISIPGERPISNLYGIIEDIITLISKMNLEHDDLYDYFKILSNIVGFYEKREIISELISELKLNPSFPIFMLKLFNSKINELTTVKNFKTEEVILAGKVVHIEYAKKVICEAKGLPLDTPDESIDWIDFPRIILNLTETAIRGLYTKLFVNKDTLKVLPMNEIEDNLTNILAFLKEPLKTGCYENILNEWINNIFTIDFNIKIDYSETFDVAMLQLFETFYNNLCTRSMSINRKILNPFGYKDVPDRIDERWGKDEYEKKKTNAANYLYIILNNVNVGSRSDFFEPMDYPNSIIRIDGETDEDINKKICGDTHERNIVSPNSNPLLLICYNKQINRIIDILKENNIIDPSKISTDGEHYSEENIRNWIHDVLIKYSDIDDDELISREYIKDVKCKDIWDKIK